MDTELVNHVGLIVGAFSLLFAVKMLTKRPKSKALDKSKGVALGLRNVEKEIKEDVELDALGKIPDWIDGILLRSGPGVFDIPSHSGDSVYSIKHWFDGLTVLHRFTISNSRVRYRNKKTTQHIEEYIATVGGIRFSFGPDPCKSVFQKFSSIFLGTRDSFDGKSLSNVGVTTKRIAGKIYNLTDVNIMDEVDPETLEVQHGGKFTQFDRRFKGLFSAAHGQHDPLRKEYVNFTCDIGRVTTYTMFAIPDDGGKARAFEKIVVNKPSYIHSFGLTQNYVILEIWPLVLNVFTMLWNKSISESMKWDGNSDTMFYVFDRNTGKWIATYSTPAFYCFHNINSFEENGNIILDLSTYTDDSVVHLLTIERICNQTVGVENGSVTRFVLEDVSSATKDVVRKAQSKQISSGIFELPRVNQTLQTKKYTFAYGITGLFAKNRTQSICKLDVTSGKQLFWEDKDCMPAEPIFLPSPQGSLEDDGVLLSIVLDMKNKNSFLLVLDAHTMKELGRAIVPQVVPFGFHGNFFGKDVETD